MNFVYKQKPDKSYVFRLDGCMCRKKGKEIQRMSGDSGQVIVVLSVVSYCFDMHSSSFTSPVSIQLHKKIGGNEWCAEAGPSIATQWNLNYKFFVRMLLLLLLLL
jgi:hypothetical protein